MNGQIIYNLLGIEITRLTSTSIRIITLVFNSAWALLKIKPFNPRG